MMSDPVACSFDQFSALGLVVADWAAPLFEAAISLSRLGCHMACRIGSHGGRYTLPKWGCRPCRATRCREPRWRLGLSQSCRARLIPRLLPQIISSQSEGIFVIDMLHQPLR